MNTLNIAYPFSPVSPSTAGGAEQIVWLLDDALFRNNHNSFVISHKDSEISGKLLSVTYPEGDINQIKDEVYSRYRQLIKRVIAAAEIDLIHMHGIDFYEYIPETDIPVLVTVHLPPELYPEDAFEIKRKVYFNCVSESEHRKMKYTNNLLPFIPNGIRTDLFSASKRKKDYCISLGRICWDKGFHEALQAARKADFPFYLGGEIYNFESHKEYFEQNINPWLDGERYKYLGPLDLNQKSLLLSEARCLLIPSLAEETSSLVAMESLASGTPVIGFNTGALPEIIEPYKTGFIVNNTDEMAEAIKSINRISPDVCRSEALRRFSAREMTSKYISLYKSLLKNPEYSSASCW